MRTSLVVLIVFGNLALGLGTLAWVVQRTERSRFRYTMWRTRDRVVRAVLLGEVQPHPALREWIDRAEILITATRYLTPFQFVMASRTMQRAGMRPRFSQLVDTAPEPVQALLGQASADVRRAYGRVLMIGSPSGWLLVLLACVSSPWLIVKQRRNHQKCNEPPLDSVAKWSNRRYGSPADVFRPLVQRPDKKRVREAAYA